MISLFWHLGIDNSQQFVFQLKVIINSHRQWLFATLLLFIDEWYCYYAGLSCPFQYFQTFSIDDKPVEIIFQRCIF